ncbi:MAG: metal-dependent hydrolase [Patescibacteria group bacterium]|nr:metal-dependent hydrolase [Patescibacteria group bacterium]MDD4663271.1 metal-dependent hydrolase [Caldisericia bacterium]
MILAHTLIGLLPVENSHISIYWFLGSVIADIDHVFVLIKNKITTLSKIIDSIRFEEKYNLRFKTKYLHSLFGAIIFSLMFYLINQAGAYYFFAAYLIHLLLDWLDQDEKEFFYPLKYKVKGWLPIASRVEIVFTIIIGVIDVFLIF